jgi:4'-phosphopantetheinyl transferase
VRPLAVHPWPGPLPDPDEGLIALRLCTPVSNDRGVARAQVRAALKSLLGNLLGRLPDEVPLVSAPGQPLSVDLPDCCIGLSVSHEPGITVAAIHLHGPVGVDVMRVQDLPDWRELARSYLGVATMRCIEELPNGFRASAFARAWTELEARLKCRRVPLTEWSPPLQECLAQCQTRELELPPELVGTVATPA